MTMIGGLFISADGSRRVIPDHWLNQAELLEGSRLLRLGYSFCTVEISGHGLAALFEDAAAGKLGAVAVGGDAPASGPCVTSVVWLPLPETPFPLSGREYPDA
jgi:hypothetical protein